MYLFRHQAVFVERQTSALQNSLIFAHHTTQKRKIHRGLGLMDGFAYDVLVSSPEATASCCAICCFIEFARLR